MEEGLSARLVQVGIRTLTPHQREQITRFDVNCIEMRHFADGARPRRRTGLRVDRSRRPRPRIRPGVSHREPGGLSVRDVITMIYRILSGPVVGADIVEYNPPGSGGITAPVAAKIVREIAGLMLVGA